MSYYNQRDSYNQYDDYQGTSKRNSNSFSEEVNGAKRKKSWWSSKKRGGGNNRNSIDNAVFKEPVAPVNRSPTGQYNRSSSRDNANRSGGSASRGNNAQPLFFDVMPDFVDPQHSGTKWNWDNYIQDCKSWQEKHKLAYYRSRCMALEFENQMLFEQINSLIQENCVFAVERGTVPSMRLPETFGRQGRQTERAAPPSKTQTTPKKQGKKNKKTSTTTECELEFEVCEDMMAFLEKSIRHKLDLRNKRKQDDDKSKSEDGSANNDDDSKKRGPKQPTGQKRKEELDLLYGSKAAEIHGLETALQLNFNRSNDTYKPELWPAVPMNRQTMV